MRDYSSLSVFRRLSSVREKVRAIELKIEEAEHEERPGVEMASLMAQRDQLIARGSALAGFIIAQEEDLIVREAAPEEEVACPTCEICHEA